MQESLEASLVRIRTTDGRVVGTGFLVGEHHILTCAHVISQALGLSDTPVDPPQAAVSLDFPLVPPRTLLTASIVQWCPPLSDGHGDIAGLELQDDPPAGAEAVRFAPAADVWKHEFNVLGFPAGYDDGVWATGRLLGRQATNWIQIEDVKAQGFAVAAGFSGTPVWDTQLQGVVGMVVAASRTTETKTAFVIPLDVLAVAWPLLMLPQGQPRNPYKGLRPFAQKDAVDFFGREAVVEKVVELVSSLVTDQPASSRKRLLTILGPSGAGKSSLVMAGLLPQLQRGMLPGSETWLCLDPIVPGKHPLESLVLTLAAQLPDRSFSSIRADLEDEAARGLHQLCTHLLHIHRREQPGARVLLLVDQCEELFTQTESEDERQRFIQLLLTACSEPRGPLVVLTLRADFYDRPMQYPELYRLIETQHLSLLAIEPDDLRRVVEQPAALADVQVSFEGDLVHRLLADVQGQVGALPLLQFTLDQLFQRRSGRQLTLSAYRELGGVKGALTRQAEEIYAALPSEEHRKLAHALFVRLIDPGATEQDTTRRRAALSEFTLADPTQTRLMRETIDTFIAVRLLTTNEIVGTTTIEVSHEVLIREWPRLVDWLHAAREDIHLQQTLSKDVTEWEQHGKPRDRLYRGAQLKDAQGWAKRNLPSEKEVTFLQASAAQRTLFLASLLVIMLLLVSSTGIAGWFYLTQPPSPTLVTMLQDGVVGSLRWCIINAPSGSVISFAQGLNGTIKLTEGDLSFPSSKRLTIVGPGADQLTISGGDTDALIHVTYGATVNISGLSFKNSMTILHSFLYNEGTLTVTNSIISDNKTIGVVASFSGGIENRGGILTITHSTISNNSSSSSGGDSIGGGIWNQKDATLTVTNSTFSGNLASSSGYGFGGGIDNEGILTVTNSTFSGNSASGQQGGQGGGIANEGILTVTNSTFSGNSASGQQGGQGGGIANKGKLIVTNSTFSGNSASGSSGDGIGGGIAISDHVGSSGTSTFPIQVMLLYCTMYGNIANVGGGIWVDTVNKQSQVSMGASIIAGNYAHTGPDIAGHLTTLGYNLVGDSSGATFFGSPKMQSTDMLGVSLTALGVDPMLRDNGGSAQPHTWTHALLPGSPAIDLIPPDVCMMFKVFNDQRGVRRPQGKGCDSGAYEYAP